MNIKAVFAGTLLLASMVGGSSAWAGDLNGESLTWEPVQIGGEYLVKGTLWESQRLQNKVGFDSSLDFGAGSLVDEAFLKTQHTQNKAGWIAFAPSHGFESGLNWLKGKTSPHSSSSLPSSHGSTDWGSGLSLPSKMEEHLAGFGHSLPSHINNTP